MVDNPESECEFKSMASRSDRQETQDKRIPFNRPSLVGTELGYIEEAVSSGHISANGKFTRACHRLLKEKVGAREAFLTHSGSAALEMIALILDLKEGDEVIMPSFTYVTTASSFVLRGAVPVFVDVQRAYPNIDPLTIKSAITERTKLIVPVHYAGVACELDSIKEIASDHNIYLAEDAAHSIEATYKGSTLGSLGDLSILSFHETKNVVNGEGGALLINDPSLMEVARQILDKGTDRHLFETGQVSEYTWQRPGASFAPGEIAAAFLLAQLESVDAITQERLKKWNQYHGAFAELESRGKVLRPAEFADRGHNGHIYFLKTRTKEERDGLISHLSDCNIKAVFHYTPLHQSPAGEKYCRVYGSMDNTEDYSATLVRLPLFNGIENSAIERVVSSVYDYFQ